MDFARILRFENTTIWAPKSSLSIWNTVLLEVSYLEERDIISDRGDYFQRIRGIKYLNNNVLASWNYRKFDENHVAHGHLVAQYSCLEFRNIARILAFQIATFFCVKKKSFLFSNPVLLKVSFLKVY